MRGLFINPDTKEVVLIVEDIEAIFPSRQEITFTDERHGKGRMTFDPSLLVYGTTIGGDITVGDTLPSGFVNEINNLIVEDTNDIINSLGSELAMLKFEVLMMKGAGS